MGMESYWILKPNENDIFIIFANTYFCYYG